MVNIADKILRNALINRAIKLDMSVSFLSIPDIYQNMKGRLKIQRLFSKYRESQFEILQFLTIVRAGLLCHSINFRLEIPLNVKILILSTERISILCKGYSKRGLVFLDGFLGSLKSFHGSI